MKEALSKKLGPLPVWGWALIGGGTIGGVLLWKKAKEKAATNAEGEALPQTFGTAPGAEPQSGSAGGGGEAKTSGLEPIPNRNEPSSSTATPVSELLQSERELREGGWRSPGEGAAPSGSAAPATAAALSAARGGTPGRGGVLFKAGTYKGMAAHVYSRAVPGGVGPGKNIVVLGHVGGSTHAAKPNHAPAHAKPKAKAKARRPSHPTHHNRKPQVKR